MKCKWHLCTNEVQGREGKAFCSRKCSSKFFVQKRRETLKNMAVDLLGGCCARCGYKKCIQALQFHHLRDKEFALSHNGHTRSWEKIQSELEKCLLLCANCHAEEHCISNSPGRLMRSR